MLQQKPAPSRFIGLDVHKHYLVAYGVDAELNPVLGPRRVPLMDLDHWREHSLTHGDALALEMTTNALDLYDELAPHVHSVTIVHPPHVALITRAQVMNDKRAAAILARLHCKGLLVGIWIPPHAVRELRALVTQRSKMVRLGTQARNRLHAALHRHHLLPPEGPLFTSERRDWWLNLPLSEMERVRLRSDLDTLAFAQQQQADLEKSLGRVAAQDERVPLLIQGAGIGLLTAMTVLAAIGDITRFPSACRLVGYAGFGTRVHDSGLTNRSGRITKAGRRELRTAMVEAAQVAANTSPHWQAELARLEPRMGRNKAIVAIARKMLVVVWHTLTEQSADRHISPERLAWRLLSHAYRLGRANRPEGQTPAAYVREQLDRLGVGQDLTFIQRGRQTIALPPSSLAIEARASS